MLKLKESTNRVCLRQPAGRFTATWADGSGIKWEFPEGTVLYGTATEVRETTDTSVDVTIPTGGGMVILYSSYFEKGIVPDITSGIGPTLLRAGNWNCGFFGEVTVEELFGSGKDASELITTVGITQGTAQNLSENWLKFAWKGKILFYPKKSIRYAISWDEIYRKGCVYGTGETISTAEQTMLDNALASDGVTIYKNWLFSVDGIYRTPQTAKMTLNGKDYVVRLMKGVQDDPAPGTLGRPGVGLDNEWNRLILPLYYQTYDKDWHRVVDGSTDYSAYVNSVTPDWKTYYTDGDLCTHLSYGYGSYAWMQEFTEANDPRGRVLRGSYSAAFLVASTSWGASTNIGLRLVLEEK